MSETNAEIRLRTIHQRERRMAALGMTLEGRDAAKGRISDADACDIGREAIAWGRRYLAWNDGRPRRAVPDTDTIEALLDDLRALLSRAGQAKEEW
jgi:hypothetical protein